MWSRAVGAGRPGGDAAAGYSPVDPPAFARMAASTRDGFIGRSLKRAPVASKTALAMAAGGGHDGGLADAAGPEGPGRRGHLDDDRLDLREVGRGQLPVVEQARIREPPLLVEEEALREGEAEALDGAALHLALDAERD